MKVLTNSSQNMKKEIIKEFLRDIDSPLPKSAVRSGLNDILEAQTQEHTELTKKLVAKKNKDCRRYLEAQKQELREAVEGMKKEEFEIVENETFARKIRRLKRWKYNQALTDVLKAIEKL